MVRSELTFLNTSGGLKLFWRILCEERGMLRFEYAADDVKRKEKEAAKQVSSLIILELAFLVAVNTLY